MPSETTHEVGSVPEATASPRQVSAEITKKEKKSDSQVEKVVGIAAAVAAVVSAVFGALASIITTHMMTKSAELLAVRLKINEARTPAYKALWVKTGDISKELTDLTSGSNERVKVSKAQSDKWKADFRDWYFSDANGMYLSFNSKKHWLDVYENWLGKADKDAKELYDCISLLRTSLMKDLEVYSEKEARTPLLSEYKPAHEKTSSQD
jgi:hypothetical protein